MNNPKRKPVMAICYDFDKTLSPDDMQAQGYIQSVGYDIGDFWRESNELAEANNMISNTLSRLLVVQEQYPALKADAQFNELMRTLKDTEDKIAITRQFYNDTVTTYNTMLQIFPNVIFAGMFRFYEEKLFKSSEQERTNPTVKF